MKILVIIPTGEVRPVRPGESTWQGASSDAQYARTAPVYTWEDGYENPCPIVQRYEVEVPKGAVNFHWHFHDSTGVRQGRSGGIKFRRKVKKVGWTHSGVIFDSPNNKPDCIRVEYEIEEG